ncbi:hypothetical protein DOTSEDRAFT_134000, partial [Dothistroma septosporum NZE10]
GFMIYGTMYENDAGWIQSIRRLRYDINHVFKWVGGTAIPKRFSLIVFDNRDKFDCASTRVTRQHFLQWPVTGDRDE